MSSRTAHEELRLAAHHLLNPLYSPGQDMCALSGHPLTDRLARLLNYAADGTELLGGTITDPYTAGLLDIAHAINGGSTT